jgi:hypothetical protein
MTGLGVDNVCFVFIKRTIKKLEPVGRLRCQIRIIDHLSADSPGAYRKRQDDKPLVPDVMGTQSIKIYPSDISDFTF